MVKADLRDNCPRPDKIAHHSEKAASMQLLELWLKVEDIEERLNLHVYRCIPGCRAFHVGHKPGTKKKVVDKT